MPRPVVASIDTPDPIPLAPFAVCARTNGTSIIGEVRPLSRRERKDRVFGFRQYSIRSLSTSLRTVTLRSDPEHFCSHPWGCRVQREACRGYCQACDCRRIPVAQFCRAVPGCCSGQRREHMDQQLVWALVHVERARGLEQRLPGACHRHRAHGHERGHAVQHHCWTGDWFL